MQLIFGAGRLDREVDEAQELLVSYRSDDGLRYLDFAAVTPPDELLPEDLAVTILINSRVGPAAFRSVQDNGARLELGLLPDTALEETNEHERQAVAEVVGELARWQGFAASVATKVLHKKRPRLIPILDNQAIFGAYMNSSWPEERSSMESIYAVARIREALEWVFFDLTRPENAQVWPRLEKIEPTRSRIELFDMVWWMYFPPSRAGLAAESTRMTETRGFDLAMRQIGRCEGCRIQRELLPADGERDGRRRRREEARHVRAAVGRLHKVVGDGSPRSLCGSSGIGTAVARPVHGGGARRGEEAARVVRLASIVIEGVGDFAGGLRGSCTA